MFDLPDINEIADVMAEAGKIAMDAGQRLSFHPGPFNCLASPTESVVTKTIKELNDHGTQMELMVIGHLHYHGFVKTLHV